MAWIEPRHRERKVEPQMRAADRAHASRNWWRGKNEHGWRIARAERTRLFQRVEKHLRRAFRRKAASIKALLVAQPRHLGCGALLENARNSPSRRAAR